MNRHLFDKTTTLDEYLGYSTQTIENGWSLSSLEYYVGTKTYQRQARFDSSHQLQWKRHAFCQG